ncbi:hypothetical protein VNO77_16515 [Canavalia gladiata]|uniref:Uncharacterized protein n=1 Tax=Canavalia gladiata TaxID=3824 RepID=A0AAN9M1B5_CANGL
MVLAAEFFGFYCPLCWQFIFFGCWDFSVFFYILQLIPYADLNNLGLHHIFVVVPCIGYKQDKPTANNVIDLLLTWMYPQKRCFC